MNRIILVSLPMLALLGCGGSKKEKSLAHDTTIPTTTSANVTNPGDSKNDLPSVTASPQNTTPVINPSTSTETTTPVDNTNQSSGNGSNGKDGNNGKDGGNGKDGNNGNNGKDGGNGKDGNNGKDGDTGQNPGKDNPADCEMHVLDFDKKPDGKNFVLGEKIKEQYRAWGVRIEGYRHASGDKYEAGEATIFDSAAQPDQATLDKYLANSKKFGNNEGFDADLTTSKNNNVLIIAENTAGNEVITYPDDNACGGKIKFFFDKPTKVLDMDFIANEGDQSEIKLFSSQSDSDELDHQSIPVAKANEVRTLKVESSQYVAKLKVILSGSGAVDNIRICVKK